MAAALVAVLFGCGNDPTPPVKTALDVEAVIALSRRKEMAENYPKILGKLQETLFAVDEKDPAYFAIRILHVPSRGRKFIALRIEKRGQQVERRAISAEWIEGRDNAPRVVSEKNEAPLVAEVDRLAATLRQIGVEKLKSYDNVFGFDGSDFWAEIILDGKRILVERWSPQSSEDMRGLKAFNEVWTQLKQEAGL